jgi:hypothetical protein
MLGLDRVSIAIVPATAGRVEAFVWRSTTRYSIPRCRFASPGFGFGRIACDGAAWTGPMRSNTSSRPSGHALAFSLDPSKAALTRLAKIAFV